MERRQKPFWQLRWWEWVILAGSLYVLGWFAVTFFLMFRPHPSRIKQIEAQRAHQRLNAH